MWVKPSTTLPWSAPCIAIRPTTSRRCWKGRRANRCGSSNIPVWGVGFPMRWARRIRICRPSSISGRPSSPVQLSGGYLGASYSATPFQPGNVPIPNLLPPKSSSQRAARPRDAGALRTGQTVPRGLRHRERNRRPHAGFRAGGQHDAEGARDRRFLHRAQTM